MEREHMCCHVLFEGMVKCQGFKAANAKTLMLCDLAPSCGLPQHLLRC